MKFTYTNRTELNFKDQLEKEFPYYVCLSIAIFTMLSMLNVYWLFKILALVMGGKVKKDKK
jgi:hypothetical protein